MTKFVIKRHFVGGYDCSGISLNIWDIHKNAY